PPFQSRFVLRSAPAWEQIGARWFPTFAGVLLVEAAKQIYAGAAVRERPERSRGYVPMPQGFRNLGKGLMRDPCDPQEKPLTPP
ncbi:MAG TPA: methyltransferase type 11, partial [Patescibacteria group bacterium]|nr:methyltransferase type 11 [Patescibacteria group bacterium]